MTIPDRYQRFSELAAHEQEGYDYRIRKKWRGSPVSVIAPHGGGIEAGTSAIVEAVAGSEFNFYCFEGLKSSGNFSTLHITSCRFDEPVCLDFVQRSQFVLAIHACIKPGDRVYTGGLDGPLRAEIVGGLRAAGYLVLDSGHPFVAEDPRNICNRGATGKGVQLELTHSLRRKIDIEEFVAPIREVLSKRFKNNTH